MTYIEKILGAPEGTSVQISPDLMIINDGSARAILEESISVCHPEKVRAIYDHDVPTGRSEGSRVFGLLRRFAAENNISLHLAKGIGYAYFLNTTVKPEQIILQCGRHASIYGSVGAVGINCTPETMKKALKTDYFTMTVPKTVSVRLVGTLQEGVSMMDVAMTLLKNKSLLSGKAVEVYADEITDSEKRVLCSMLCENGAVTAIFAPVESAEYTLDISAVVPMVTMPCEKAEMQNDANRTELSNVVDVCFHAGQIGGYTGGTIEELRKAAKLTEGRKLKRGFRLSIVPATSDDYLMALREGIITQFIDYGAQIHAVGDRSIVIQGAGALGEGENLLTTGLYTYKGCMGVPNSYAYTASTQSVMKASMADKEG